MKKYFLRKDIHLATNIIETDRDDEFSAIKKRVFRCCICKLKLSTKTTLKRHIIHKHFKFKPYTCIICKKKYAFEKELFIHEAIHRSAEQRFKCHLCSRICKTYSSYTYHRKSFHTDSVLKCSVCSKHFTDKWQLRRHLQNIHLPKIIACPFPLCNRKFCSEDLLQIHFRIHSKVRYECPICQKKFKLRKYMERHKSSHEGLRPYKCTICDKSYISISHLNEHSKRTHLQIKKFLCAICGKMFASSYEVVVHERTHEDKNFFCDKCNFIGHSKPFLNRHMKLHEPSNTWSHDAAQSDAAEKKQPPNNAGHYVSFPSESKPFKCVDCEKCFKTAIRTNEHWRKTHRSKKEQRSNSLTTLKNGTGLEADQDPNFRCDVCCFVTPFRIALFSHSKIHSKNLDGNCPENELQKLTEEGTNCTELIERSVGRTSSQQNAVVDVVPGATEIPAATDPYKRTSKVKQPKSKTKSKRTFDFVTQDFNSVQYNEGCGDMSESHLFESSLLSSFDLNISINDDVHSSLTWDSSTNNNNNINNNNNDNNNKSTKSSTDNKNFTNNWHGKIKDPRTTLNCTTDYDLFEDTEFLKLQNFT